MSDDDRARLDRIEAMLEEVLRRLDGKPRPSTRRGRRCSEAG